MTPDEFKGAFRAMAISTAVAGWLVAITGTGLFLTTILSAYHTVDTSASFRWWVFWPGVACAMVPAGLVALNALVLGLRYAVGRHPERKRLTRAEKRAVRKALAEKRSEAMEQAL